MALRRARVRISLGPQKCLEWSNKPSASEPEEISEMPAKAPAERKRPNSPFRLRNQAGAVNQSAAHGQARYSSLRWPKGNQGGTAEKSFVPDDEGVFINMRKNGRTDRTLHTGKN